MRVLGIGCRSDELAFIVAEPIGPVGSVMVSTCAGAEAWRNDCLPRGQHPVVPASVFRPPAS